VDGTQQAGEVGTDHGRGAWVVTGIPQVGAWGTLSCSEIWDSTGGVLLGLLPGSPKRVLHQLTPACKPWGTAQRWPSVFRLCTCASTQCTIESTTPHRWWLPGYVSHCCAMPWECAAQGAAGQEVEEEQAAEGN
jgi:hypothetical protein